MANLIIDLNVNTTNGIRNTWMYSDIKIPPTENYDSNADVIAVREAIGNIFNWRQGQRILYPEFGNILYGYIYEGLTETTIQNMKKSITSMLGDEPRMNVINIDITANTENSEVTINMLYNIPSLDLELRDSIIIRTS